MLAEGPMEAALKRILYAGFIPVVAHVKRSLVAQTRPNALAAFVACGCVFQVNASGLLASAERRTRKTSWNILKNGLVQIIASDGHRPD